LQSPVLLVRKTCFFLQILSRRGCRVQTPPSVFPPPIPLPPRGGKEKRSFLTVPPPVITRDIAYFAPRSPNRWGASYGGFVFTPRASIVQLNHPVTSFLYTNGPFVNHPGLLTLPFEYGNLLWEPKGPPWGFYLIQSLCEILGFPLPPYFLPSGLVCLLGWPPQYPIPPPLFSSLPRRVSWKRRFRWLFGPALPPSLFVGRTQFPRLFDRGSPKKGVWRPMKVFFLLFSFTSLVVGIYLQGRSL